VFLDAPSHPTCLHVVVTLILLIQHAFRCRLSSRAFERNTLLEAISVQHW